MSYLRQNSKIRKAGVKTYNFGIPAFMAEEGFRTCPNAGQCVKDCYAQKGFYVMQNVKRKQESSLRLARASSLFYMILEDELQDLESKRSNLGQKLAVRIHDSGDFFSEAYFNAWEGLALAFPKITFYGYTKEVKMVKAQGKLPKNMKLVFSYGGRQDKDIGPRDRHSLVFPTREAIKEAGYVDATDDDSVAWQSKNHKIGLLYRGRKNFIDTGWAKVYQSVINNKQGVK